MTADNPDTLLEAVLEILMRLPKSPEQVLSQIAADHADLRTLRLIRVLLEADAMITATFNGGADQRGDARLARAVAVHLAKLADLVEEARPGAPVVLRDLAL